MAFSHTLNQNGIEGDKIVVRGTFTSAGGSTGGDIMTGLAVVEGFKCQHTGNGVVAASPTVNGSFPLINAGGVVTIVTTADRSGIWEAWGY